jgi:hypothetical protein
MSKGSAPRKARDDKSYQQGWEAIFGKLGSRREVLQEDSEDSPEQAAIRSLESPRDSRDKEVDR